MEILHIFFSDNKFLDPTIEQFEKANPGNNKFLVILRGGKFKFDQTYYQHLSKCNFVNEELEPVLKEIENSKVVIIHRLSYFLKKVVSHVKRKDILISWFCWGGDIYSEKCYFDLEFILERETKEIYLKLNPHTKKFNVWRFVNYSFGTKVGKKINSILNFLTTNFLNRSIDSAVVYRSLERINYIACVIPDEYFLLKEKTNLKANQIFYSYTNIKLLCGEYYDRDFALGTKILCGNAATYTNNHADIFDIIKKGRIDNELIVPLSYGDSDQYADEITQLGEYTFGSQFNAVREFLSRDAYSELLTSCGYMIINSKRQEAVGNIILGLYMGMKVFLNSENTVYKFLISRGFVVFNIKKDFSEQNLTPLTPIEKDRNRQALEEYWGEQAVIERIGRSINLLDQK